MKEFSIAAAQIGAVAGNVAANTETHAAMMRAAAARGVDVVVFPELSLTGYEPRLAASLAFTANDLRLQPLALLARELGITAILGAPLAVDAPKPAIGAVVLGADGAITAYHKMHLHPGEEEYFTEGAAPLVVAGLDTRHIVGVAVCADITHASHPALYAARDAGIYAAGVFITDTGYAPDTALLADYARRHDMLVVMANYNAPSGGYTAAGRSAIWAPGGQPLASADDTQAALVIARDSGGQWLGDVLALP